jgi:short subunit dehydrogenase-like uncharacterized protein
MTQDQTDKTNREFDIIVWGATGFTGALVCEYLLAQYGTGESLRWAIAGRDAARLDDLKTSLGQNAASLTTIVADSFDDGALRQMVVRCRTVITTVGPYAKYGSPLVAACVAAGTHYCDLAGEAQWIRSMIDKHHEAAVASGAKIVTCCGFDSVPMDVGVWFLQKEAQQRFGEHCSSISMYVKASSGTVSGGTIASMLNIIEESRNDRSIARILVDPYSLNPANERAGPDGRDQQSTRYDKTAKVWTAPFVMAGINTKVVRRSHALQGYPYGKEFRYREAVMFADGLKGRIKATMLTVSLGIFMILASIGPTRKLLARFVLPKPGEGPSAQQREQGFFNLRQFGKLPDGRMLRTRIRGDRDPGYGSTSKMLSECAVCLAKDELPAVGGVLTPAAAMGENILRRLESNAGLSFDVLD